MLDMLTDKSIRTENPTTERILKWPDSVQKALSRDLLNLLRVALPKMPIDECEVWVSDFFKQPGGSFQRHAILIRDMEHRLIGTSIFDCGPIMYEEKVFKGIYMISSAVLPRYQAGGIGKSIGIFVLNTFNPDVLFSACTQSQMLHSRVRLCQKGLVTGYDVYPRLEQKNERDVLITLPYQKLDCVISVFKQIYLGVVDGVEARVNETMNNLTVHLVRKNMTQSRFDFDPWFKDEREDKLARMLDLTGKDGVLVTFIKKPDK
jgi:hypothetical protein